MSELNKGVFKLYEVRREQVSYVLAECSEDACYVAETSLYGEVFDASDDILTAFETDVIPKDWENGIAWASDSAVDVFEDITYREFLDLPDAPLTHEELEKEGQGNLLDWAEQ